MSSSDETARLSAVDYVVFGILLAVSAAVGIFFAYRDRKKNSSERYLLGGRKISWWASGISCALSFYAGSTIIGVPAEVMYRGSAYIWMALGTIMANFIACEVFLPIYYKNGMSSANEYLGKRFGKYARYAATVIYILQTISYTGVMIYAPALAFDAVSDLSLVTAVLSTGIVCTIYTTLGGLKAVIWTDVIQATVMTVMLIVTLFIAAAEVGGFSHGVNIAWEGDRIDFNHFEFDPRYRITFWSTVFGLGMTWTSVAATNQSVVQRFLCCRSIKDGKKAIYATTVITLFQFAFLLSFTGFILYAYFAECDPIASGKIATEDQVLPYMVTKIFTNSPGVSGLFVAGVFSGALSTVSSAINGMTCVTTGDLLRPIVNWSDQTFLWVARGLTFVYGALCIGFAFLASALGGVVQATLSLLGLCAGALLGAVTIGVLFPVANEKGAIAGMVAALSFNIWLFVGAWIYPPPLRFLNVKSKSVAGCEVQNYTSLTMSTSLATEAAMQNFTTTYRYSTSTLVVASERPAIAEFYAVSFGYYAPLGLMVCILVGLLVSVITGGLISRYRVDPDLICLPFEHPVLRWLPYSFRQFMVPKMGRAKLSPSDKLDCEIVSIDKKIAKQMPFTKDNMAFGDDDYNVSTEL